MDHNQLVGSWTASSEANEVAEMREFGQKTVSKNQRNSMEMRSSNTRPTRWSLFLVILSVSLSLFSSSHLRAVAGTTSGQSSPIEQFLKQNFPSSSKSLPLSQEGLQFDSSSHKNVYDAIRAHPDLREFAQLCESRGVKEIVAMDKTQLTVFAPIDRSLSDLLGKIRSSQKQSNSINLVEFAKHHIALGLIMSNADDQLPKGQPMQFYSYESSSPLYLNELAHKTANTRGESYVNNARILQTHLIPIEPEGNYQVLHIIDLPLDYVYLNRRQQIRAPQVGSLTSGLGGSAAVSSMASLSSTKFRSVKRALSLDDLLQPSASGKEAAAGAILEFAERFGDLRANLAQADVCHARALRVNDPNQRVQLVSKESLNFDHLAQQLSRQFSSTNSNSNLKRRLVNVSESNTLNTYFLPVNSEELEQILKQDASNLVAALEAHVIPDQVLFTRQLDLGRPHATLASQKQQQVTVSLAKTIATSGHQKQLGADHQQSLSRSGAELEETRKLLATPLLLEAQASLGTTNLDQQQGVQFPAGLTSSEILLANIAISSGVLHLIKRPVLLAENNLLDYINDNDNQLTNVVRSIGSRSGTSVLAKNSDDQDDEAHHSCEPPTVPVQLNRFRELLARDRQLLATFSDQRHGGNRTILAPSDEAFARLRYDLRALVLGDETLIPQHWDPAYRSDVLERILKRHLIADQALTSGQLKELAKGSLSALSSKGQVIQFSVAAGQTDDELEAECDGGVKARLVHKDFVASNGVLHVLDRVLGEEQETLYTLIKSLVLRQRQQTEQNSATNQLSLASELQQLIEARKLSSVDQDLGSMQTSQPNAGAPSNETSESPEFALISKTIGQYLEEMGDQKRTQLSSSVNISYHLAQFASKAENRLEEWAERFKLSDKEFTYFIPNDLAWLRLQQARPELYKPLVSFLLQQLSPATNGLQQADEQPPTSRPTITLPPRPSESSHRLLQILERHLVANRKLSANELGRLSQVQTLGATLRLVDALQSLASNQQGHTLGESQSDSRSSAFAALHSIIGGSSSSANQLADQSSSSSLRLAPVPHKALKLNSNGQAANIVEAHEASNGYVYLIDQVLLIPEDSDYLQQTSSTPNSPMSALLGGHNSAFSGIWQTILSSFNSSQQQQQYFLTTLIGTLSCAIVLLAMIIGSVLIVRRRRRNKLNSHQQLESGLASSSSCSNTGSTSTTKSL